MAERCDGVIVRRREGEVRTGPQDGERDTALAPGEELSWVSGNTHELAKGSAAIVDAMGLRLWKRGASESLPSC